MVYSFMVFIIIALSNHLLEQLGMTGALVILASL